MNKSKYDKLEIPKELSSVVYEAIETGLKSKEEKIRLYKKILNIAAVIFISIIIPLNVMPSYAKAVQEIPFIGELAKILIFREYHFEDEIKYIDAKIPQLNDTGKTDLEKRVNQEINKVMYEELKNSEENAKEYYEAFVETGGAPKDFIPIGINIDYEIKHITDKYVSFIISKSETFANAYNIQYFYNIDMETGRYITLKDWLGNDYKRIVVQSIENTISNWTQEQKELLWKDINFEDLINENTSFYINEQKEAVVVFEKYEVAVGSAGIVEFPIKMQSEN